MRVDSVFLQRQLLGLKHVNLYFLTVFAKKYVNIKPKIAGIIPAIITDVKGRWNVSAAAIALGLGDIKFPAFPPTNHR